MERLTIANDSLYPEIESGWAINSEVEPARLECSTKGQHFELNPIALAILAYCDGSHSVARIIESLCMQYPGSSVQIPADVESALHQVHDAQALRFIPAKPPQEEFQVPEKSAQGEQRQKLCIGMATYDDYDGVYFSIQAIRLYHPEIIGDCEFVVIDNHPGGPCSESLKKLETWIPSYRYVPSTSIRGTAVRDLIFREANADYVLCIDSHVMIAPGAVQKLLDYFIENTDSADILQGPLVSDNMWMLSTHFNPVWREGMYGIWSYDDRGADTEGEPFDIPMQGLGLFACRKAAWPGFNPRFAGFGGEEGYIHEKFRQAGGRSLCLPFLRWIHRFDRPMGTQYRVRWEDRIRNYLIGHDELGLDLEAVIEHFQSHLGDSTDAIVEATMKEMASPFYDVDGLFCLYDSENIKQWNELQIYLDQHKLLQRAFLFDVQVLSDDQQGARQIAFKQAIQWAEELGYKNVLFVIAGAGSILALEEMHAVIREFLGSEEEGMLAYDAKAGSLGYLSDFHGLIANEADIPCALVQVS